MGNNLMFILRKWLISCYIHVAEQLTAVQKSPVEGGAQ